MGLVIPKCNADSETLNYTLKVYYDVNDWVSNSDLIDNLSNLLIEAGIEDRKKEPQSYTKKTQVLSYYGLIEWEDSQNSQSRRRITDNGRKLYEYRKSNNTEAIQTLLLKILSERTFGRNVVGCESDSDLEAPNIFIKSAMILKDLTNKEFAYILGKMEFQNVDLIDVLFEISMKRGVGLIIEPENNAAKWADPKPILALADWGLLDTKRQGNSKYYNISRDVLLSHTKELLALRTKNTEKRKESFYQSYSFEYQKEYQTKESAQYLRAMRTKPFLLLAGISGTGKSRIVKQMAFDSCPDNVQLRKDETTPGNYCLVEVKPNWHDSSELIGYESQIGTPHYVVTTFVRFLAKAMLYEEQRVPFFVCLDEMNLAPVEQYFAEFLSVLESRKGVGGTITSEALIPAEIFTNPKYERQLKEDLFGLQVKKVSEEDGKQIYDGELADAELAVYNKLKEQGLRIPSNLIVIGTVNMDETTHQFSRKVIDRAMTIEMNLPEGEPFMDFFNNARELEYTDSPWSPGLFLPTYVRAVDVVAELSKSDAEKTEWLKKEVAKILTDINEALDGTPFKIAYRVQNELMLYFRELWQEDKSARWREILKQSVDQILMMKVLPRVEGDEELLEKPLANLAAFCEAGDYANAAKKVEEMQKRLERTQFTSYWP